MARRTWPFALHRWHHTSVGYLLFAAVELGLAYAFVSLAIDTGSLWYYGLAVVCLLGALQNLVKLIAKLVRHQG